VLSRNESALGDRQNDLCGQNDPNPSLPRRRFMFAHKYVPITMMRSLALLLTLLLLAATRLAVAKLSVGENKEARAQKENEKVSRALDTAPDYVGTVAEVRLSCYCCLVVAAASVLIP